MVGQTRRGTPYTTPPPTVSSDSTIQASQVASSPLPQLQQMASTQPANVGQMPPVTPSSTWPQNSHTPMIPPCVGGITTDNVPWTGGSSIPSLANVEPETACALRSKHVKDANDTYTNCTKGIDSRLELMDPRTKEFPTPLKTFQKLLWEYLKDHGMDTVFRITLPSGDECCLVTESGRFYDNYSAIQKIM